MSIFLCIHTGVRDISKCVNWVGDGWKEGLDILGVVLYNTYKLASSFLFVGENKITNTLLCLSFRLPILCLFVRLVRLHVCKY